MLIPLVDVEILTELTNKIEHTLAKNTLFFLRRDVKHIQYHLI